MYVNLRVNPIEAAKLCHFHITVSSFNKHLVSSYSVPDTVLVAEDIEVNETDISAHMKLAF